MSDQLVDQVLLRRAVGPHHRRGDDHRLHASAVHSEQVEEGHARRPPGDGRVRNHAAEVDLPHGDENTVDQAQVHHDKHVSLCVVAKPPQISETSEYMTASSFKLL